MVDRDSDFPEPSTRERLGREPVSRSILERPWFPPAPPTPRDASVLEALPLGHSSKPRVAPNREASTLPAPPEREVDLARSALWATLGGFAVGVSLMWALGAI